MAELARPKVFVTRRRVPDAIALLSEHFDVEVWGRPSPPPKAVLMKKAAVCQAMLTEVDDVVDRDVLAAAKALRVVANRGVGLDHVDVAEATRLGIAVTNTPGLLAESCADMAFALILAVARRIAYADRRVRTGKWKAFDQTPYLGTDVHGKTLGIVGLGQIGTMVAKRAIGFEMRVLYHSRRRKQEEEDRYGVEWSYGLDPLLATADYITLHVPLKPETRGLIGKRALGLVQPTAVLVNCSRGPIVDTEALTQALAEGKLAGAAMDVTDPEPLPRDHPLLKMDNVVVTPHISSASAATFRAMGMLAARNIVAALNGEPMPSCVNADGLKAARDTNGASAPTAPVN